jgi:hypothetical protein
VLFESIAVAALFTLEVLEATKRDPSTDLQACSCEPSPDSPIGHQTKTNAGQKLQKHPTWELNLPKTRAVPTVARSKAHRYMKAEG